MANYELWDKRWQALKQILQADDKQGGNYPRYETLQGVRQCLHKFGQEHYEFFANGFKGANGIYLEPSLEYPKEYVLSTVLQQIGFDLEVILRAAHQRAYGAAKMREMLSKADFLACQALNPAIAAGFLPPTTVVTYYQKSVTVRLMPYVPAALIGIPLTAMNSPCDLLAIPHEVGHYVYRHGIFTDGPNKGARFAAILANELAGQPQWLLNWVEEIFADVYGCLVAGPVITRSFQDLQKEWSRGDFMMDDGEHPIGALRAHVYHQVLKANGDAEAARKALEKEWQAHVATRHVNAPFTPAGENEKTVELSAAEAAIDGLINILMSEQYLGALHSPALRQPMREAYKVWMPNDLKENESTDRLYEAFTNCVDGLSSESVAHVPELCVDGQSPKAGTKCISYKLGATGLWIDALKASKGSGQPLTMPAEIWTALLSGNGWATEGPGGANTH